MTDCGHFQYINDNINVHTEDDADDEDDADIGLGVCLSEDVTWPKDTPGFCEGTMRWVWLLSSSSEERLSPPITGLRKQKKPHKFQQINKPIASSVWTIPGISDYFDTEGWTIIFNTVNTLSESVFPNPQDSIEGKLNIYLSGI